MYDGATHWLESKETAKFINESLEAMCRTRLHNILHAHQFYFISFDLIVFEFVFDFFPLFYFGYFYFYFYINSSWLFLFFISFLLQFIFHRLNVFFFSVDFDFIDFFVMGHRQILWFICPIFLLSRLTARWKPSCLDFTSVAEYKLTLSVWFLRHFDFYLIRYCVGMFYVVFKFSGRCEPMCL